MQELVIHLLNMFTEQLLCFKCLTVHSTRRNATYSLTVLRELREAQPSNFNTVLVLGDGYVELLCARLSFCGI